LENRLVSDEATIGLFTTSKSMATAKAVQRGRTTGMLLIALRTTQSNALANINSGQKLSNDAARLSVDTPFPSAMARCVAH
jgi:hypothetical protein